MQWNWKSRTVRHLTFLFGLFVWIDVTGCASSQPRPERFHESGRVDPAKYPDVDAVEILRRTEVTFSYSMENKRPYAESTETRRIQILRESGVRFAKFRVPYDDRSVILGMQSRRIPENGDAIDFADDLMVDVMRYAAGSPAAKLYGEQKGYKQTKVSGLQVGDVMEVVVHRVHRDARWLDPIFVEGRLPIVRAEVVVDSPKGFDVRHEVFARGTTVAMRPNRIPTQIHASGASGEGISGQRMVFLFEDQHALYPEPYQPRLEDFSEQVVLQLASYRLNNKAHVGFQSQEDVAAWYSELVEGKSEPDATVKSKVKELRATSGRKTSKITKIQRYLQDEIEDVPLFMHISGTKPASPGALISAGIGDAKDQASLGIAMLKAVGIGAFPVLVGTTTFGAIASPALFSNVLVAVPAGGKYIYIDPTTRHLPLGRLPGNLQGKSALLVKAAGASIIQLPLEVPSDNQTQMEYSLALNDSGLASGSIDIRLTGNSATAVKSILESSPDALQAEALQKHLGPGVGDGGLIWQAVTIIKEKPDGAMTLRVDVTPARIGKQEAGLLSLNLERVVGRPFPFLWREVRYTPMILPFLSQEKVKVKIKLPKSLGVDLLPEEVQHKTDAIDFRFRWAIANGELLYSRETDLTAVKILPDTYRELRRPVLAVWDAVKKPLRLAPNAFRGEDYGEDPF